jgi:hypothetical protein
LSTRARSNELVAVAAAGDADRLNLEQAGFQPAPEFPWSKPRGFAEFVCRHAEIYIVRRLRAQALGFVP